MKQFFKFVGASMLGFVIGGVLLIFIFFASLFAVVGSLESSFSSKKEVKVEENTILHVKLDKEIVDQAAQNPFGDLDLGPFSSSSAMGLNDILRSVEQAKDDEKIKGIFLQVESFPGSLATLEEVRNALDDFKTSGKWIVAYSENMTQGAYFVSSVADKIYMYPQGQLDFKGLATTLMFFKNTLSKLEVDAQIIRGKNNKFKSAVEPFMYDKMSDANREQLSLLLNTVWDGFLTDVAKRRNISVEELNKLADNLALNSADDAVKYGFVDALKHYDEVHAELMERVEVEKEKDLKLLALEKYFDHKPGKKDKDSDSKRVKERIAVIYASGEIRSGKSSDGAMGSETIAKAIKEARTDSNVKAIVLRVNSPGGSALASDVIWRETVLARQEKPFIVSMGDLAASGGYYISANGERIFADHNTITGSIGVFGMIPNAEKMFNNKLGITFDNVKTNEHSDWMGIFRGLDNFEYEAIQRSVETVYDTFLYRVAMGRNLSTEFVDSIGQGRVWTGADAIKLGLVDEIGGLKSAIAYAKEQAGLENYRLKEFPEQKDPIEELIKQLSGEAETRYMKWKLGAFYDVVNQVNFLQTNDPIQARLPFVMKIQP